MDRRRIVIARPNFVVVTSIEEFRRALYAETLAQHNRHGRPRYVTKISAAIDRRRIATTGSTHLRNEYTMDEIRREMFADVAASNLRKSLNPQAPDTDSDDDYPIPLVICLRPIRRQETVVRRALLDRAARGGHHAAKERGSAV